MTPKSLFGLRGWEAGESDGKERRAGRRALTSVCDMKICGTGALGQFSQELLASREQPRDLIW